MKFNFLSLTIIATLFFTVSITSCTKDITGSGDVVYELEHTWASSAFALNTDFTTDASQTVKLTKFKYILSNFVFIKSDGTEYAVPESYYLVDASLASSSNLAFKNIPAGDYTGLKYIVGVDSARNTAGAQTGALTTTNDLYWSWNSGYVFLKAEGTSPQSSMGLTYHVGGFSGANAAQRSISVSFGSEKLEVRNSKEAVVHANVNVKKLFTGIDVSTTNMVHMPGAGAVTLANNYATFFTFEHLHN